MSQETQPRETVRASFEQTETAHREIAAMHLASLLDSVNNVKELKIHRPRTLPHGFFDKSGIAELTGHWEDL
jgi:hypothetical protein